ncbi:MAG: T9SS type A sorting domain-containing protein [Aureispira sp.]|nr:T9SS type A sorting domain-containing protein [Aureispira sp.]
MRLNLTSALFIFCFLCFSLNSYAITIYVDANATGNNNGSTWANAYTDLGEALFSTASGEVWVAAGTYLPSKDFNGFIPGSDKAKTFKIPNGVKVYGGFNGTETMLSQRNWQTNLTILEGDFGNGNQSYHLVRTDGSSGVVELDGFTLQNGYASTSGNDLGGAIYATNNSNFIVRNCIFQYNQGYKDGGTIHAVGGSVEFHNCDFENNTLRMNSGLSTQKGGVLYLSNNTAQFHDCNFQSNTIIATGTGREGVGMYLDNVALTLRNCVFEKNTMTGSGGKGGGIYADGGSADVENCRFSYNTHMAVYMVSGTNIKYTNCLVDNSTNGEGGILLGATGTIDVTNCTFTKNELLAPWNYYQTVRIHAPIATISNCIFYDHRPNTVAEVLGVVGTGTTINNCLFQKETWNVKSSSGSPIFNNTIIGTPNFVDPDNDDYRIACGAATNAGTTAGLTLPSTDLAGQPRIFNGTIDLGAYENQSLIEATASATTVCTGTPVRLMGGCDNSYTWSHGVVDGQPFTPTATTTYTCTASPSGQTTQVTVNVVSLNNENVVASSTVCLGDETQVTTGSSVTGVEYYLRNDDDNTIVDGPIIGTGTGLTFNTNEIYDTSTYNVYGIVGGNVLDFGQSLDSDGLNDKINTPFCMPNSSNFSVEAWVYAPYVSLGGKRIIMSNFYGTGSADSSTFTLYVDGAFGNKLNLKFFAAYRTIIAYSALTEDTWHHVAATFDNGDMTLYVDGDTVATDFNPNTYIAEDCTKKLAIGEDFQTFSGQNETFEGKIDEVRVWNKTLTEADIDKNKDRCLTGAEPGLLLYYNLEEGKGSNIVADKANGKDGVLYGMDPYTDWGKGAFVCSQQVSTKGQALDFDGTVRKVMTNLLMPSTSTFSVETWVYPRSTDEDRLISNYEGYNAITNKEFFLDTYSSTNNNGKGLRFSVGNTSVDAADVLTLDTWNHVAATFNNGTIELFVNGISVGTGSGTTTTLLSNTLWVLLGNDYYHYSGLELNGKMDEVRIWNKVLTQSDISSKMNTCLVGNEANLLLYYNFDEGTSLEVKDKKVGGNNYGLIESATPEEHWTEGTVVCNVCAQEMTQKPTIIPVTLDTSVTVLGAMLSSNESGATYQWLDCNNNNNPIVGATNQSFTPTSSGNYAVEITVGGCTTTSSCYAVLVTGLESIDIQNRIVVYPNPTKGKLILDLFQTQENIEGKIVNIMGQVIEEFEYSNAQQIELDLKGSTGVYFIQLKTSAGLAKTIRVIKY